VIDADTPPVCIYVLAGPNGVGKSSIAGAMFRRSGTDYFNPDEAARRILTANPDASIVEANALAWNEGKRLLETAITERQTFAIETTLGGRTIAALLKDAASRGIQVRIWFAGLRTPDLNIERVRARVARGGHNIPDEKIRERYDRSRLNLIDLIPVITELKLYDNSEEADPAAGVSPKPTLVVHLANGHIVSICELIRVPEWAKPIVAAALRLSRRSIERQ
jgi:predicted ABC-type ATPase